MITTGQRLNDHYRKTFTKLLDAPFNILTELSNFANIVVHIGTIDFSIYFET